MPPPGTQTEADGTETTEAGEDVVEAAAPSYAASYTPAYVGPTPADPFAGQALDIFDLMERAEAAQLAPPPPPPTRSRGGEVTVGEVTGAPAAPAMPEGEVEAGAPAEPSGIEVPKPQPVAAQPAAMPAEEIRAEETPAKELASASPVPPPVDVDAAPVPPEARKRGWWRK